jgi:hypothetical protein
MTEIAAKQKRTASGTTAEPAELEHDAHHAPHLHAVVDLGHDRLADRQLVHLHVSGAMSSPS